MEGMKHRTLGGKVLFTQVTASAKALGKDVFARLEKKQEQKQ